MRHYIAYLILNTTARCYADASNRNLCLRFLPYLLDAHLSFMLTVYAKSKTPREYYAALSVEAAVLLKLVLA